MTNDSIIETYEHYMEHHDDPQVILVDFDDVLFDSAVKQFNELRKHKDIFDKYFLPINDDINVEEYIKSRSGYYFDCLAKVQNLNNEKDYLDVVTEIYSDKNFYDVNECTNFALGFRSYVESKLCKKAIIITKCLSDTQIDNKVNWCRSFFRTCSDKIDFCFVDTFNGSKSKLINDNDIYFDSYVEDNLDNIIDVIENIPVERIFGREIMIPKMGYNNPTNKFSNYVSTYNLGVYYF